jgi:tRNA threonylcarbamoyladenosine biosynthesis protein TsaB
MSYLLHINTALETAFVGISKDGAVATYRKNESQKEHGAFLQPAIKEISSVTGISLAQIDAVSVINGPGSYTGLRVGLSAAKGICYALHKPLICLSTLKWLAFPFRGRPAEMICPLIDARRMEVFTTCFNPSLEYLKREENMIVDNNSFPELDQNRIIFTGNGREKLPEIIKTHRNSIFPDSSSGMEEQSHMSNMAYDKKEFSDLAYAEPFYLKSFYIPVKNKL